ncbi:19618_t:CDS:2, partial [Gigaspora rosea]
DEKASIISSEWKGSSKSARRPDSSKDKKLIRFSKGPINFVRSGKKQKKYKGALIKSMVMIFIINVVGTMLRTRCMKRRNKVPAYIDIWN